MKFRSADIAEVAPKERTVGPRTDRAERQAEILEALSERVAAGQALVVELDDTDKPLTVRNRIEAAAVRLGITVFIRRKGNEVRAYKTGELTPEEQAELLPGKPGRKPKSETATA